MVAEMLGRTSTDDDSPVCPKGELEACTALEIKTGEGFVSMVEKRVIRQMEDNLWLLDTGATGHFTCDPRLLENHAECSRVLRCAREVTRSRSWGPVFFVFSFDLRRGWYVRR